MKRRRAQLWKEATDYAFIQLRRTRGSFLGGTFRDSAPFLMKASGAVYS